MTGVNVDRDWLARALERSELTVDDALFGIPFGWDDNVPWDGTQELRTPHAALMEAVLPAVLNTPCRVSFSGGRDSSTVLAVATKVARREGLPDPIPVTFRHDSTESQEDDWQGRVLEHLGITERVVINVSDELRLLGPYSLETLALLGPHWPPNVHGHLPLLRTCGEGGSLLTGVDGDGLLGARSFAAATTAGPSQMARALLRSVAPAAVRRARLRRRLAPLPWLTETEDSRRRHLEARQLARPLSWSAVVAMQRRSRAVRLATSALSELGSTQGIQVHHPLFDEVVCRAIAHAHPLLGFESRAAATAALVDDTLPRAVVERTSKASFDRMYEPSREAVDGLPSDLRSHATAARAFTLVSILGADHGPA